MSLIYNFGTTVNAKAQNTTFENLYSLWDKATIFDPKEFYFTDFLRWLDAITLSTIFDKITYSLNNFFILFKESLYLPTYIFFDLNQLLTLPKTLSNSLVNILSINTNLNVTENINFIQEHNSWEKVNKVLFSSENINSTKDNQEVQMSELTNNIRFTRFNNPLISYDYKCGNYIGSWEQLYPALMTSYIEVARNIRKAPWFFSDQFTELLKNNFNNFNVKFTTQMNLKLADVDNWYSSHVNPTDNYTNLFYLLKKNEGFVNVRWVALNSLDQKFYKMFDSSSTQQRILANW
jgi:hypothetical protein